MKTYYGFIYLWENKNNKRTKHRYYIGQHVGTTDDGYTGSGTIFLKYYYNQNKNDKWERTILEYCNEDNQEKLDELETHYIKESNAVDDDMYCNCRFGGRCGGKLSNNTKSKISKACKGRVPWNKGKKTYPRSQKSKDKNKETLAKSEKIKYDSYISKVLNYIKENGYINRDVMYDMFGKSCTVITKIIKKMISQKLIKTDTFGDHDLRYILYDSLTNREKIYNECVKSDGLTKHELFERFPYLSERYIRDSLCKLKKENKLSDVRGYRKNIWKAN